MKEETRFWRDLKNGKFVSMVKESSKGKQINTPKDVFNVMKPVFAKDDDIEQFWCIFLNTKNKIIATEKTFSGTINQANVYPREVIKRIINLKASAVIIVHNHPSGDPQPSKEDKNITGRLWIALKSIQVTIHDHIVIGEGYYSFRDSGFFDSIDGEYGCFLKKQLIT